MRRLLVFLHLRKETAEEKIRRSGLEPWTDITERAEGTSITIVGTQPDYNADHWLYPDEDKEDE